MITIIIWDKNNILILHKKSEMNLQIQNWLDILNTVRQFNNIQISTWNSQYTPHFVRLTGRIPEGPIAHLHFHHFLLFIQFVHICKIFRANEIFCESIFKRSVFFHLSTFHKFWSNTRKMKKIFYLALDLRG